MNSLKKKNQIKRFILSSLILGIGLLFSNSARAFQVQSSSSIFDVMHYQEVLKVKLETDFELLQDERFLSESLPSVLSFKDKNGKKQRWNIKVKQRGNFRRVHCSELPPLKFNFKKSELEAAGLATWDDMKLVTHCIPEESEAEDLLYREYLAYKLFNELTDQSYRVQLLKITYVDRNTGKKNRQWGFLIEDTAQLKARLSGTVCEDCYNFPLDSFDQQQLQTVSLFQYLIGNSDWSLGTTRNLKLISKGEKIIPVPYDFDFSGLVNASYAIPNGDYKMATIRDRIYLGFPELINKLEATKLHFVQKRGDLIQTIQDFKPINSSSQTEMVNYLTSFFEEDINQIQAPEKRIIEPVTSPK